MRIDGIKKLCLGTVQLGTKYGINNELGRQPTEDESFQVLEHAVLAGIKCFDTASVYGNAEKILGNYGLPSDGVKIISKLRPDVCNNTFTDKGIACAVVKEIRYSLKRLRTNSIYGYMLHRAADMQFAEIIDGLLTAKSMGLVKKIGVSIYEPEEALAVANDSRFDIIQIPYNVLDQRLDATDFFQIAKQRGLEVYARSAFLQGLLLMDIENIPSQLAIAVPYIKRFRDIASEYGYNPAEASILYSACHKGIDKIVFGVDTVAQLDENLKIMQKLEGFADCYKELHGAFINVEKKILVPSLWNS